jgi:hypothetical protein
MGKESKLERPQTAALPSFKFTGRIRCVEAGPSVCCLSWQVGIVQIGAVKSLDHVSSHAYETIVYY